MDLRQIGDYDFEKLHKVIVVPVVLKNNPPPLMSLVVNFLCVKEESTNRWQVKTEGSEVR